MPNWCANTLIITGAKNSLDKIESTKFDFNNIIPMPQEFLHDTLGIGGKISSKDFQPTEHDNTSYRYNYLEPEQRKIAKVWIKKYGYPGWYYWSCANWGTKWNSSEIEIKRMNKNKLRVSFSTPWCPPSPILLKISKEHNCKIKLRMDIEGDGIEHAIINKGIIIEIPEKLSIPR